MDICVCELKKRVRQTMQPFTSDFERNRTNEIDVDSLETSKVVCYICRSAHLI